MVIRLQLRIQPTIFLLSLVLPLVAFFALRSYIATAHPILSIDETTPFLWPYSGGTKFITFRSQANELIYGEAIYNAANTWNNSGTNVRLWRTDTSGEQVTIVNEIHPLDNWSGLTVPTADDCSRDNTCYIQSMRVIFNDFYVLSASWENAACHEFGHVLGLNHDNLYSNPGDCTFYGNNSTTPGPHSISDLKGMYPSSGAVPSAPHNLRLNTSPTAIQLFWKATEPYNAAQAGFKVERRTATAGEYAQIRTVYDTASYSDSAIALDTNYCYRVRAYNGVGNSAYSNEVCTSSPPGPPPPTICTSTASFLTDVTYPDGSVLSPTQSFNKTWRLNNSGTSTWNGFTLAFINGNQMGGPASVGVPTTRPGQTVDITVPLVAPSNGGNYRITKILEDISLLTDIFILF